MTQSPRTASSRPADAARRTLASLEVPALHCQPTAAPYRSILVGPASGAHGAGSRPCVTWGRGGALTPPGGRRVAPAAARGPGPAAARAPPAAVPPLAPRSGTVHRPLHPGARARARGLQQQRSFTLAPAHVWKYLDCTKSAGAEGGRRRRVEGGGACLGHAHSVSGRKGRARARLTGSGTLGDPFGTCVTLDE